MAGRWQDDHQEQWRPRDDEPFFYGRDREQRSWDRDRPGAYAARRSGLNRDPVFGERETGASYGSGGPRRASPRFTSQDYTGGGRYYGDDSRERIWREEYGQGGRDYGDVPRGYDADRNYGRQAYDKGGYDYGRGYGDGGRNEQGSDRIEDAGRSAGEFLHRAGERVASWLGGGQPRGARGLGPKGYKRSDERISDDVHERLTEDAWLDASFVLVTVVGGEVTLSGTVDGRDAKHRAERIVEDVSGVTHVQNNLRSDRGKSSATDDNARARKDDPVANGSGESGAGQSTAGRKN